MVERVECVVVGAGVVGLAVARRLARDGREVIVLEAAETIGAGISSRNSEIIHAGLYYPRGSLKGRLCVAGRDLLYRYCAEHGVAHRRSGKLVVATEAGEVAALARVRAWAEANGVHDLRLLSAADARALEPEVKAVAALLSPSTGCVDGHGLMLAYRGDAEAHGAMIAVETPLIGGRIAENGIVIEAGGVAPMRLKARVLVNCAGLGAQAAARALAGLDPATVPPLVLAKGSYFILAGRAPFSRPIYPPPTATSLGVHATLDLAGRCRFGPDIEWIETIDYAVDPTRAARFQAAVRRYWPGLPDDALIPGYAGIRPKTTRGGQAADFVIRGPRDHGVPGLVNLFGIESPGLTASLAIADHVAALLADDPCLDRGARV